jgi:hypothetical protein
MARPPLVWRRLVTDGETPLLKLGEEKPFPFVE